MTIYKVRKVIFEPVEIPDTEVMTVSQAAKALGITINGVKQKMKDGGLTWLELDSTKQGRQRVLRREVETMKRKQQSR